MFPLWRLHFSKILLKPLGLHADGHTGLCCLGALSVSLQTCLFPIMRGSTFSLRGWNTVSGSIPPIRLTSSFSFVYSRPVGACCWSSIIIQSLFGISREVSRSAFQLSCECFSENNITKKKKRTWKALFKGLRKASLFSQHFLHKRLVLLLFEFLKLNPAAVSACRSALVFCFF